MDKITETAIFGGTPYWAQDIELKPGISGGLDLALLGIQTARDNALGFADEASRIDADDALSAKGCLAGLTLCLPQNHYIGQALIKTRIYGKYYQIDCLVV